MILNIRGTSGSGKTYLVRQIMEALGPPKPILDVEDRVEGYELRGNIRVVGSYERECGGCDTLGLTKPLMLALRGLQKDSEESEKEKVFAALQVHLGAKAAEKFIAKALKGQDPSHSWGSVDRAEVLVRQWAELGDAIFEGLLINSPYYRWVELSQEFGNYIWAFLDTPLEVCHQRVLERNGGKSINLDNLKSKYTVCHNYAKKAQEASLTVVWLEYERAFEQVMQLLQEHVPELRPRAAVPRWKFAAISPL